MTVTVFLVMAVNTVQPAHVIPFTLAVTVNREHPALFVAAIHDAAVTLYENLTKESNNVRTICHSHNKNLQHELYVLL